MSDPNTNSAISDRFPRANRPRRRARRSGAALAILAAAAIGVGACGGADDPNGSGDAQQAVQCGSAELFLVEHDVCDPMAAVAEPDQYGDCPCLLGFAWNGSECVALGNCQCVGPDCNKLTETVEECEAAHASCGAVSSSNLSCGDLQLYAIEHDVCEAMDAAGAPDEHGHCLCLLGFAWNGSECVELGDCQCVGADCDKLTETPEECEAAHAGC